MKKIKQIFSFILVVVLAIVGLGKVDYHVRADDTNTTNVVITKVEIKDHEVKAQDATDEILENGLSDLDIKRFGENAEYLGGVSFTYYEVSYEDLEKIKNSSDDYDTVEDVENNTEGIEILKKGTTNETALQDKNDIKKGQVSVPLEDGFYWFVENGKGTIQSSVAVPFGLSLPITVEGGTRNLDTVHVYPKNIVEDVPSIDEKDITKSVDEESFNIGDENTWTIKISIPKGIEDYDEFYFTDVIDSQLDYIKDSVKIEGLDEKDYDVTFENSKLTVDFEKGLVKLAELELKEIEVTFKTKINNTAEMGTEIPNKAILYFDNGHGKTGEVKSNKPFVYTSGHKFLKVDAADENTKLKGAIFKIKNQDGLFVKKSENKVDFVKEETAATEFTSGEDGDFEVKGLEDGEYTLIEVKAPKDYALPTDREVKKFTIAKDSYKEDNPQKVENKKMTIPQTGGIGTTIFTVVGGMLMILSVLYYRRSERA